MTDFLCDYSPTRPRGGANFRPKILRNKDGVYVMWFNFQPPTPNVPGYYTVATSTSAIGPYKIIHEQVNVSQVSTHALMLGSIKRWNVYLLTDRLLVITAAER